MASPMSMPALPPLAVSRPGCVPPATLTSTRGSTRAGVPRSRATSSSRRSSQSESATVPAMPAATASSSSRRLLATPLNTAWSGEKPARSAFQSSPPELTSMPAPAARTCSRNHRLEQALPAKNTRLAACRASNARRRRATFAAIRACE